MDPDGAFKKLWGVLLQNMNENSGLTGITG